MKRRVCPVIALILMMLAALACGLPGSGGGQPSSPDQVETIVAATIQALTPAVGTEATSSPEPEASGLLPHSLYFMNNDATGILQVYRLEKDGKTLKQITTEPSTVSSYDVSPVDGSVAYVANNQLLLINADGSGRRMLVDGGAVDPNDPFLTSLTSPVFSPNGQVIAYNNRGLILYSLSTGVSNTAYEEIFFDTTTESYLPGKLFIPQKYSPDGTRMLVTVAIPNSDGISAAIYTIASDLLTPLAGGDGARVCCSEQAWTGDSSALFVGISSIGYFSPGLWRMDAATGNSTALLPAEAGGGNFNFANMPYLAPDGQLYFFYAAAPAPDEMVIRAPLQIVRSAPDGVTGRTVLNPENFQLMNEALWAPDASFVVVASAPIQEVYSGGIVEVVYFDGRPSVELAPFAENMKWGP